LASEAFAGVTAIEVSMGGVTVRVAEPLTEPDVAVMVLVPCAVPLANPELEMVAMFVAVDAHVAVLVRS